MNAIEQHTQAALSRIFQLCNANRAALLKAREDTKLSRVRLWYRDGETENENHKTRQHMKRPNIIPGPWKLGLRASERFIYGALGAEVCNPNGFFNNEAENLANARVIAALPALLEALESCLERMDKVQAMTDYPLAWPREQARSALRLAGYEF